MRWLAMLALASALWAGAVSAESYISSARQDEYRGALDDLSLAIMDKGYAIVKIQPVDKGLRNKGYALYEDYKLVFFGSKDLERVALNAAPEMAALLPLKIILYQDKGRVVAAAPSLDRWAKVFASERAQTVLKRIDQDVRAILEQYGGTLYFTP